MIVKHSIWRPPRVIGIVLCVLFLCMFTVDSARSVISTVEVIPANPTSADSVRILIGGGFVDGCWSIFGHSCMPSSEGQVPINIFADDSWFPGMVCLAIYVPYVVKCDYGKLQAGHYMVTVSEDHNSLRNPFQDTFIIEFDVTTNTYPVKYTTWGRIRALFR